MITREVSPQRKKVRVTFTLPSSVWADTIHLVGDFNAWDTQSLPLKQTGEAWTLTLELETGREYRYRYLYNGKEWHTDSNADKYVSNPCGSYDAIVIT